MIISLYKQLKKAFVHKYNYISVITNEFSETINDVSSTESCAVMNLSK
jgi:hypothetical protein